MRPVLQAVPKGFPFVCIAQSAAEVEHCVVIFQRQGMQIFLQLLETVTDFLWIAFVGFCIGLISITITALQPVYQKIVANWPFEFNRA